MDTTTSATTANRRPWYATMVAALSAVIALSAFLYIDQVPDMIGHLGYPSATVGWARILLVCVAVTGLVIAASIVSANRRARMYFAVLGLLLIVPLTINDLRSVDVARPLAGSPGQLDGHRTTRVIVDERLVRAFPERLAGSPWTINWYVAATMNDPHRSGELRFGEVSDQLRESTENGIAELSQKVSELPIQETIDETVKKVVTGKVQ